MEHTATRYERTDVGVRTIIIAGVALAILSVLISVIVYFTWRLLTEHEAVRVENPMRQGSVVPPEPRVVPNPPVQLQSLRQSEEQRLTTYGWVDKEAGTVRVPLNRAIEIQLERGFPVRPAASGNSKQSSVDAQGREAQ